MITKTEKFTGSYVPFEASDLLKEGSITDGLNVAKDGLGGVWRPRRGFSLINTNSVGSTITGLFQYTNPKWSDYHLITQTGGTLRDNAIALENLLTIGGEELSTISGESLLAISSAPPLEQTNNLGSSIFSGASSTKGYAAVVGENWIYADGSGKPVIWGGDNPTCDGFIVDDGSSNLNDYSKAVKNNDTSTYAVLPADASMVYYVGSLEPANEIKLTFGTNKNNNVATATVSAWRSGSWTNVSAADETATTQTHDTDGSFTWTEGADEMSVIGNMMRYWYRVSVSAAMDVVDIVTCRVGRDPARMTNKWNEVFSYLSGVKFYDDSASNYIEALGAVSDQSESTYLDISSAQTADFLYVKTPERAAGVGFLMVVGQENSGTGNFDNVEYWNGTTWTALTVTDETLDTGSGASLAQSGVVWIASPDYASVKRTISGDNTPGHWLRFSWDAALDASTQIAAIVYASMPDVMPTCDGVVEYNGRAVYWGPFEYQNRLLISPYNKPDQLDNLDDRYSPPFGGEDIILRAEVLGEYVLVLKQKGVFLMQENSDGTFSVKRLTNGVGISDAHSLAVAEIGESTLRRDEVISVGIWRDLDGFYKISTSGNILKISDLIGNYFDPNESEYIGVAAVGTIYGYISPVDGTYRAILPDKELVYNIKLSEWYPPWTRPLTLSCAEVTKETDNSYVLLAGTEEGHIVRLENDTSDKDSSNNDVAINHKVRTRVVYALDKDHQQIIGTLRGLWALFKEDSGTITTRVYLNRATSGTALSTPSAISLSDANLDYVLARLDMSYENTWCFEFEFESDTIDQAMEIVSFTYAVDPKRSFGL